MGYQKKRLITKIVLTVVMAVISIIMLLPFAWMLSASFKRIIRSLISPLNGSRRISHGQIMTGYGIPTFRFHGFLQIP